MRLLPASPSFSTDPKRTWLTVLRIRPISGSDASNVPQRFQRTCIHAVNSTTLQVDQDNAKNAGKATFTFDRVIGPDEGQPAVYECAESLVEAFLEGHNVTILAYGQTASGKSYTMGTDRTSEEDDNMGDERVGITPRAVASVFEKMKEATRETKGGTTFGEPFRGLMGVAGELTAGLSQPPSSATSRSTTRTSSTFSPETWTCDRRFRFARTSSGASSGDRKSVV